MVTNDDILKGELLPLAIKGPRRPRIEQMASVDELDLRPAGSRTEEKEFASNIRLVL